MSLPRCLYFGVMMSDINELIFDYIQEKIDRAAFHYEEGNLDTAELLIEQARIMSEKADDPEYFFFWAQPTT